MTMNAGRELMAGAIEIGTRIFTENGELTSSFIAEDHDGAIHHIMTPWCGEEEKVAMLRVIRHLFHEKRVVRYVLLSEVWMVNRTGAPAPDDPPPRECEDRTEHLQFLLVDSDGTCSMVSREIIRPMEGGLPTLADPVDSSCSTMAGRMVNLLTGDAGLHHDIVRLYQ